MNNLNEGIRLYDIVSVMDHGQRAHEPIACIAATSPEAALAIYEHAPFAYLHPQSGEAVEGLSLAAYETHYRRFNGPFTVGTPGSAAVEIHEDLTSAVAAMQFVGSAASVKCAQGWIVALPQP